MKYPAQLQENREERNYILHNIETGENVIVGEQFLFYEKRGEHFPQICTRTGRQIITILCPGNQCNNKQIICRNVPENATSRKKNIFKFIKKYIPVNKYEIVIQDKFIIDSSLNCEEYLRQLAIVDKNLQLIVASNELEFHFKRDMEWAKETINDHLNLRMPQIVYYKWINNKQLNVKYIPAP